MNGPLAALALQGLPVDVPILGTGRPAAYATTILADNPEAYWRLNDSGTIAIDLTGHGHTGTLIGGITKNVTGAIGDADTAMAFDGSTGYVRNLDLATVTTQISIEGWVKLSSTPGGYVALGGINQGVNSLFFGVVAGTSLAFRTANGVVLTELGATVGALGTSLWHHCVGTYDGTVRTIYFDGTSRASDSGVANWVAPSNGWFIGARQSGPSLFFPGSIDEPVIYSYALSAAQVLNHYQARLPGIAMTMVGGQPSPLG